LDCIVAKYLEELKCCLRSSVSWSKPNDNLPSFPVNAAHHLNLGTSFGYIALIDADGVCPECSWALRQSETAKSLEEVYRNSNWTFATNDSLPQIWVAPDVGEGFISTIRSVEGTVPKTGPNGIVVLPWMNYQDSDCVIRREGAVNAAGGGLGHGGTTSTSFLYSKDGREGNQEEGTLKVPPSPVLKSWKVQIYVERMRQTGLISTRSCLAPAIMVG
jgi:hypothetical protein